ncbi:hypothetical protein CTTA_4480 [Comamonas testosteroni]|uniref:DUF932 domain-containing protein n=1 Tax=Comamonas testosteroni TaxID=285 RepID=A0A5A7MLA6_COMTE|nr:hypothetical protein CTTA_4480 [Comamonas testosteroni]
MVNAAYCGDRHLWLPDDCIDALTDPAKEYRRDTQAPLSVVSSRYQVVQPREVLEFYRDLTEVAGYELETAGVLKAGRKFWALARTGKSAVLKGKDVVNGYLLLATSCDGTLATVAMPTTVRVVCNNTLTIALRDGVGAVKVPHSTAFDAQAVIRPPFHLHSLLDCARDHAGCASRKLGDCPHLSAQTSRPSRHLRQGLKYG